MRVVARWSRRPGSRGVARSILVVALLAVGACSTYVPVSNPTPGSTVRVRVPVTSALDGGAPGSATIEGDVISSGDTLVLGVTNRQEFGAYREVVLFDTLRLAPDQIMTVEEASFSTGRTAVLTVAIVAGAVGLALTAFSGSGGDDGPIDGGPPPPQGAVVASNSFVSGVLGLLGIAR